MAITMGLGGVIAFAYPLITNAAMVQSGSWSWGFYLISIIAAVALLVIFPLIKDKPADVNQVPDGIEPARILGVCALLAGVGAFLGFICTSGNIVILYAYYILLGIAFGGNTSVMPTAFANYFGIVNFPKIMGVILLLLSVFSCLVPIIAGIVFDVISSYTVMFLAVTIICAIGAIATFLVRYPKTKA